MEEGEKNDKDDKNKTANVNVSLIYGNVYVLTSSFVHFRFFFFFFSVTDRDGEKKVKMSKREYCR